MSLLDIPTRNSKETDIAIAKKSTTKRKVTATKKGGDFVSRIAEIKAMVSSNLGKYAEESLIINDLDTLHNYVTSALNQGIISIDTETTGLDPLNDTLVGICIYTPNEKTAYIPLNHISYITMEKVQDQLPISDVKREFERLKDIKECVMFNAPFDIRFLKHGLGVKIKCTWDCYLGARLMNENEPTNGLKKLHQKYCLDGKEDAFSFDSLFKGISFDKIPINIGYLYAAHDPKITYELYEFQKSYLTYDSACTFEDRNGMNGVAWVFHNIEMPTVGVVVEMEDNGITFDFDYANQLSTQYNNKLKDTLNKFYDALDSSGTTQKIDDYRLGGAKLDNPINIASSTQIAILLYDILGVESQDIKNPRGTGVDILSKIDNDICKIILEYREISKLLSTYIDKLPNCVNSKDNRIHCKFNQYGADTGRFSSSDPNMQNIPSHNKEIRKMFRAQNDYVLMSSDFSQQEPKCLAALCRMQGDSQMYDTFMQGKDLYSEIASKAFNMPYEECLEHFPKGTYIKQINDKWYYSDESDYDKIADGENDVYDDGKSRRSQAKSILLGVLYGRGVASIAEQLGTTAEVASEIKESVFRGFPAIKQFEEDSLDMAREIGYVTTVCGRKRRLPDLMLNEYEFEWEEGYTPEGDILDFDDVDVEIPQDRVDYYWKRLHNTKKKFDVFQQANKEHIHVIDNTKKIADATRQCVNARIQGSAADLTKLAMIELLTNQRLKELGFKILIPVHDEIIAECPRINAKECSELLAQTMSKAAEKILEMPIECDVDITEQWYGEKLEV